ncbi:hypothetical protein BJF78_10245 [Pseudonocardia sp. CNS-139]|nr:hypothetical protein BJF78_10245 [Pseudonocardia sp. CNS-139]
MLLAGDAARGLRLLDGARSSSTDTSGRSRPVAQAARFSSSPGSSSACTRPAATPNCAMGLTRNRSTITTEPPASAGRITRSTRSACTAAAASALARTPESSASRVAAAQRSPSCSPPSGTTTT